MNLVGGLFDLLLLASLVFRAVFPDPRLNRVPAANITSGEMCMCISNVLRNGYADRMNEKEKMREKTGRRLLQQQWTRAYCTHVMGSPQRKWKIAEIPFRRTPVEGSDVGAWYRGRGSKGDGRKVQIKPHPSELCTKNVNYNRTSERTLSSGGGFFLMLANFYFIFLSFREIPP